MATWNYIVRTKKVHEWYVPNGCWNQLQQALNDALRTRSEMTGTPIGSLSDDAVLFKAVDDGIIVYYEIEITDPF